MRLKEIKPGMVIHCKNNEEKKALLEEAERLGYRWINSANLPTDKTFCFGMTIHFYNKNEWKDYKHIAWSDKTDGVTEFSNLIMPEITADEVVEWLVSHYEDGVYVEAFGEDYKTEFLLDEMSAEEVVRKIAQWKYDHEKKEPEVEEFWEIKCIEDSNFHTSEHYPSEADALVMAKVMAKKDTENTYYAVRVFKAKAVE